MSGKGHAQTGEKPNVLGSNVRMQHTQQPFDFLFNLEGISLNEIYQIKLTLKGGARHMFTTLSMIMHHLAYACTSVHLLRLNGYCLLSVLHGEF